MFKINKKVINVFLTFVLFYLFLPFNYLTADTVVSSTINISAQVVAPSSGGGGGGGGGGGSINMPTSVNFSGMAYPSSKVVVLNNGNVAATTYADPTARFAVSLNNLDTGVYNFSLYGEDKNGLKSLTFSFPVYVLSGSIVNIGGIFLSPTIEIDKSEVKKGDSLSVFGQTVPNVDLSVIFHSDLEILRKTKSDPMGLYKYNMDTTPLEYGDHNVNSKTFTPEQLAVNSPTLPFVVGLVSKLKNKADTCGTLRGDLNCDSKVNLVDFSIMAYWYKRYSPPTKIDLSGDGSVTLVDFSIMAFNWTG